jgi:hypothetical protein
MPTTIKQRKTIKDVLSGMPVSTAMRKNGYSEDSAKALKIKNTEAWKELVTQYLPDSKVFKAHQDALEANKLHGTDNDFIEIPDHQTRLKAVDMAYRLKGYSQPENVRQSNTQVNITLDTHGYIPPNNVLKLKPTFKSTKLTRSK